jgi:hypothetical protein
MRVVSLVAGRGHDSILIGDRRSAESTQRAALADGRREATAP